jgi:hypothetical protein
MYFPPAFFDISVHFTTHLIKEIKLLGPVFLHQMYAYERFNSCAHFHVLQQISIVSEYLDEHKEVLLRDNPGCNEHMRKFIGWFRNQISQSSDTQTSEYIKKLAHGPIFTIVT